MRRTVRWLPVAGLGAGALLAALGAPAGGQEAPDVLSRAFTVVAEAYPTEPAPGSQDQPVAIRPFSSRAQVANPPANGYARAAATDLGLAEGYLGPQGPSAEADTSVGDGPHDVVVDEDGAHLEARVSDDPAASALATHSGPEGGTRSRTSSAVVDGALVAEASAEVQDLLLGPLLVGSGRFDATVRVDGTPGGASGSGRVVVSDATVGGIPVVLDAAGVRVDESQVPLALLDEATAGVQEAFSQGGYSDIRVVQPRVTIAEDGSAAEVSGGGVFVLFTNNDPTNRYFVQYTLLGGRAAASVGAAFDVIGPPLTLPEVAPAVPAPTGPAPGPRSPASPGAPTAPAVPAGGPAEIAADLAYADGEAVLPLRGLWPGWPWVLGAGAVLVAVGALAGRSGVVRARTTALLDEYARG